MITRDKISGRPGGITYLTTGQLKEDMEEIAAALEHIYSGEGAELSDEDFRTMILSRVKEMDEQLEELFQGMNYLGDALKSHGILPADTQETPQDAQSDPQEVHGGSE